MREGRLRGILLLAGAGAVLALVGAFGTAGAAAGFALIAIGLVLSARAAPRPDSGGPNWWGLMAAGAALALIGIPLELVWETPGGLLTAGGAALVVVGVALGLP